MTYIPDKVKVLIHERTNRIEVYSADEGHEHEPALPASVVTISYLRGEGITAQVHFTTDPKHPGSNTVDAGYSLDAASFSVAPRFETDLPVVAET